ncbi:MAG: SxtJ family membrane protein [Planctomycetaceae bacterium]
MIGCGWGVAAVIWWGAGWTRPSVGMAIAGIAVATVYQLVPPWRRPIYAAWDRMSAALGALVSTILLGLVYFLVLTPLGLLRRWFGADPLQLRTKAAGPGVERSYWIERREAETSLESSFRQY